MDHTTRNALLLFLLFGLFLLRAPQLAGPSTRPARTRRSRDGPQPRGAAYDGAAPPLLRHAPSSRPTWPICSETWAYWPGAIS